MWDIKRKNIQILSSWKMLVRKTQRQIPQLNCQKAEAWKSISWIAQAIRSQTYRCFDTSCYVPKALVDTYSRKRFLLVWVWYNEKISSNKLRNLLFMNFNNFWSTGSSASVCEIYYIFLDELFKKGLTRRDIFQKSPKILQKC